MKTKRIAFLLMIAILVMTVSVSDSPDLSTDYSSKAIQLMVPGQSDTPIDVTGNAELAQQSSSGVGTRNDPYIIEGKTIDAAYCVQIRNTDAFFVIRDSDFIYYPPESGGITVVDFVNVYHGTIENCYVRGGAVGVSFRGVDDCHIVDCVIFDAYDGILLENSNNCTVVGNKIFGNTIGTMFANSASCDVINNTIYSNSERGVHLEAFSENNTIAGNEIGWNTNVNLLDNGVNTAFNDGVVFGNSWSDYNESQIYNIQGSGGSTDIYASLLSDTVPPTVYGLLDTVVDVESSYEALTWTVSDVFHHHFQISIEGVLDETGIWDGRPVTFEFSDLPVGTYVVQFSVFDGAGNVGTDEVTVSVISFILGGIGTELVMLASGVTVVCFVILILVIKRMP